MNDITSRIDSNNNIVLTRIETSGVVTTITLYNDPLTLEYILKKFNLSMPPQSTDNFDANKTTPPDELNDSKDFCALLDSENCFLGECDILLDA